MVVPSPVGDIKIVSQFVHSNKVHFFRVRGAVASYKAGGHLIIIIL